MNTTSNKPEFAPGDRVIVHVHGHTRPAVIDKHAPYRQRGNLVSDGYYVRYSDATEQWHSHGGWQPASALKLDSAPQGGTAVIDTTATWTDARGAATRSAGDDSVS